MGRIRHLLTADLTDWRMAGPGGFRQCPDGVLESHGGSGLFWYSAEAFGDFSLTVEWRLSRVDDNSGVFIRCPPLADSPQPAVERGYEIQIDDRGLDPERQVVDSPLHLTGAIYKLAPALRRCSRPLGEWNIFEISAVQDTIDARLNGLAVSRLEQASRNRHGHIGLQNHHEGSAVQFRNLRVVVL